jgi:hypothetical protein
MKTIIALIVIVMSATVGIIAIPHTVYADSCYKDGYETGRNGPFSQDKLTVCGDRYEHGFMAGCLSVMGNDKEVCNLAEDAQ